MDETAFVEELPALVIGLLAVGLVLVLVFYRRADFIITVQGRQVTCKGKCPLSQVALAEFFLRDLALDRKVTIFGRRRRGRIHLTFRGHLTKGDEQRIRNYLLASQ